MTLKTLFSALLLSITSTVICQNIKMDISVYSRPEFLLEEQHSIYKSSTPIAGEDNSMYYIYRKDRKGLKEYFSVRKMTRNCSPLWNFDIPRLKKKYEEKISIVEVSGNDEILVITWSQAFYKEETGEMRVFKLKKSDGTLLKSKSFCLGSARNGSFKTSTNGKYIMVNRPLDPKQKNKNRTVFRTIINSDLEVVKSYSGEFDKIRPYYWGITNEGITFECLGNPKEGVFTINSMSLNGISNSLAIHERFPEKKHLKISLKKTNKGNYVISMLESDSKNTLSKIHLLKLNESLSEFKHITSNELTSEQIEEYYANLSSRSVRWNENPKIKSSLKRLGFREIIEDNKGNMYAFLQGSKYYSAGDEGVFYYGSGYYEQKDDLLLKFDQNGQQEWAQIFVNYGYSKYRYNANIYFNEKLNCLEMLNTVGSKKDTRTTYSRFDPMTGNETMYKKLPGVTIYNVGSAMWSEDQVAFTADKLSSTFRKSLGTRWMIVDFND